MPGGSPITRLRRRLTMVGAAVGAVVLLVWSITVVAESAGRSSLRVLCSSIDAVCQQWARGYTQRTGIPVLMERLSTGEALARLSRPGGTAEFDIWHGGPADSYVLAVSRGLLQQYNSAQASDIPQAYKDPSGWWTGTYLGLLGFCSNRRLLDQLGVPVPRSWDDLLDPRLSGLLSIPNPVTSGTGYVWLWTQTQRLPTQAAFEYLVAVDRNVLQYTNSGLAPAGIAGRGEAAVAVTFSQHCIRDQDAGMSDLVWSYPREGSGIEIGSVAISADASNLSAARKYVDWALSYSAQAGSPGSYPTQIPTRPEIPVDPRLIGGVVLDTDPHAAAAARTELIARFKAEVDR